ncbi:MAG TPA: hypothetical protein DEA16_05490 [Opitutae bacterium]|nr:hypothetical protein [Opitutae bacterium]
MIETETRGHWLTVCASREVSVALLTARRLIR